MQQVKIFKTNNKNMLKTQDEINEWLEVEGIKIVNMSTTNGVNYKANLTSNYDEIEIFLIIVYEKN